MAINNKYDFVILFDVENGNPNGDPDAGNTPRYDPETGIGLVTDVCIKRKIRNYVELVKGGEAGYSILVKPDRTLNAKFTEAYTEQGLALDQKGKKKDDIKKAREYICKNYFDVRAFGAVMSTGDNPCGIVRGPVQLNFAKSVSPIEPMDITVTRQAITNEKDEEKGATMGKKSIVPYALYRAEGHISAALAQNVTGLSDDDIELLWNAIINMFEDDHSAARGEMTVRKLYIFKHENYLGNAPARVLFDKISVEQIDSTKPARKFADYKITVDDNMLEGVEFISKI